MRRAIVVAVCLTAVLSMSLSSFGQSKKKKPVPILGVKGTKQMAGGDGKIGTTCTLGKGSGAINFTLTSAEYNAGRLVTEGTVYSPLAEEKLLVLHYTVQNPNPTPFHFNWGTLRFTAVDSDNENRQNIGNGSVLAIKEGTPKECDMNLQPGQKVGVVTAIRMPAKVSIPKLIVQCGDFVPVLRVFFGKNAAGRPDIRGLTGPVADPADPLGATARADVPCEVGASYPIGNFDMKVVEVKAQTGALGSNEPHEGNQLIVATVVIKNASLEKRGLGWATFEGVLKTADGEKTDRISIYKAGRAEEVGGDLEPGEEYTARIFFEASKDTKPSKLSIWEGEGARKYTFDVSK